MIEKKELIDYLRNLQKRAEIESKVNGLNVWVLLGALAVVAWQLVSRVTASVWRDQDAIASTLLLAVLVYVFSIITSRAARTSEDIRYLTDATQESETLILDLILRLMMVIPAGLVAFTTPSSFSPWLMLLFGVAILIPTISSIKRHFVLQTPTLSRFPKPQFISTQRSTQIFAIGLTVFVLAMIVEQGLRIYLKFSYFKQVDYEVVTLLVTTYYLLLVLVDRKQKSHEIAWTYEVETALVLGAITPEIAIRRIEHQALGPKMQDVMDRFFDEVDKISSAIDLNFDQCRFELEKIYDIPADYETERSSRITNATALVEFQISELKAMSDEFSENLKEISKTPTAKAKPKLAEILPSLIARDILLRQRVRSTHERLRVMVQDARQRI